MALALYNTILVFITVLINNKLSQCGARTPAVCRMSLVVLKQLFGMVVITKKDFQLYTVPNISKQQFKTMECGVTNL